MLIRSRKLWVTVATVAVLIAALFMPMQVGGGRVVTTVEIARTPADVFDYVSTPGHWPDWHPSSLSVSGGIDHSLAVGEQVTESFSVAGRRGRAVWPVTSRAAPRLWVIDGNIEGSRGGGTVSYQVEASGEATRFRREFVYHMPNLLAAAVDLLVLRAKVEAESTEALRRLKAVLEKT